ncbi:MAG TPA: hypothetical protein VH105_02540 [Burkholderiales bacterium]|jgi:hypothetical protein|nr:hypothetical protein [Burkholderiales bacterium]
MSRILISFLLGCILTAGLAFWLATGRLNEARDKSSVLEKMVAVQESELLGYTRYATYLGTGKQSLAAQLKLLAASVVRDESATQVVERSILGLSSHGMVAISYTVEYSFGYDLRADNYEIRPSATGIEVRIGRPVLVAAPAVQDLKYEILSGGLFTDEKAAVLRLYEQAAARAKEQGHAMELKPEVVALCEKKLIAFLRDFLAKQPGVKLVPQITIVYK